MASNQAVVIGDPLQIEPVVTAPKEVIDRMAENLNLSHWNPFIQSAQSVADRLTKYGAYIKTNNGRVWTGVPLRVHHRCSEPMFSISNAVAYDNQMVSAKPAVETGIKLPKSSWINIESEIFEDTHVIPMELEALDSLLKKIKTSGYKGELFVITPFKKISNRLHEEYSLRNWAEYTSFFKNESIGTVHSFQGREADIVVFMLGGNPNKHGSRKWASSKPNLLNVALTRAKLNIYFIGNRALWGKLPYFSEASAGLANNLQ